MRKIFSKIHLWLSVPFGIFITLICFSGAMMVFETEITEACRHDVYYVKAVGEQPLPIGQLMEKAAATLPDSVSVTGISISSNPERTWQVSLSKPRRASLYIDPYTGQVTGKYERLGFFDTMFHLHRWLMGRSSSDDGSILWGKLLVGISTIVLVFILITGVVIWWPRNRQALKNRLSVSCTKGWRRFWYDSHVALGFYATIFLLAMALTGLTWSFGWYRTAVYSLFGAETGEQAPHTAQVAEPKTDNRPEDRGSRENSEHRGNRANRENGEGRQAQHGERPERTENAERHGNASVDYTAWDKALAELQAEYPQYKTITVSAGKAQVAPNVKSSMRRLDTAEFDAETGRIQTIQPYQDQAKAQKLRGWFYAFHTGIWGGIWTKILYFLAALIGACLPLTGYYLWIKRIWNKKN